ncbi:MAG: phasin family protein [Hyphomicrobium sp.]
MYDTPSFEIPSAVRDIAERNVTQVRHAYEQVADLMRKAQDAMVKSQGAMTQSAIEIQAKSLQYAQANIEQNFKFAADLARARDLKDYLEIQSRYAQAQLAVYAQQAQDITRMMGEAAHKSQPKP